MNVADGHIVFEIDENSPVNPKQKQAFHGLYRSLVNNMVVGVSAGYTKTLELVGVGYRVSNQGNLIEFALGYTHPIFIQLPKEIKVETKSERNQNPILTLESCDKQLLGLVCAKIRSFRKPEPYKDLPQIHMNKDRDSLLEILSSHLLLLRRLLLSKTIFRVHLVLLS